MTLARLQSELDIMLRAKVAITYFDGHLFSYSYHTTRLHYGHGRVLSNGNIVIA
jgi:hypothetical protein